MAKDYARKYKRKKTRLSKLEEKRNLKQAVYFGLLSIVLIILLVFKGFPALIKLVVLFGEYKSSDVKQEKSDTLAPNAPTFEPLVEATHSASISLKGYAPTDTLVKIFLNGEAIKEIQVDEDGEFKIRNVTLKEGKNRIKARVIDKDNNESDYSRQFTVVLDTEKPDLEIISPNDGDKFFDKDREIKIEGVTEKEATVYINSRLAVVDSQSKFSSNLELKDGENEIKIKAEDLAGNISEKKIKVNYSP